MGAPIRIDEAFDQAFERIAADGDGEIGARIASLGIPLRDVVIAARGFDEVFAGAFEGRLHEGAEPALIAGFIAGVVWEQGRGRE